MNSRTVDPAPRSSLRHETFDDAVDLLDGVDGARLDDERDGLAFFWHDPGADRTFLGVGAVRHFVADGPSHLARVASEARTALGELGGIDPGLLSIVGGFAFADGSAGETGPLPGCWFLLPKRSWRREGGTTHFVEVDAPDAPPPSSTSVPPVIGTEDAWDRRVESALAEIRRGSLDKVVLSRRKRLARPGVPLRSVLRRLRETRPGCVTFAIRNGGNVFFGSTPEWMVRLDAAGLHAPALAGTYPRGDSPDQDGIRGAALLACLKNRREHRAVVDGIVASLVTLGIRPEVGDARILLLPEAMHLRTDVTGRVPPGLDVLRVASVLHPTPAVCGTPRAAAASFLQRHEADRGWYTGGIGWMDGLGRGEVVVGLRSALLDAHGITVHGGAGIVTGSAAASEFAETELKMNAMLDPLRALDAEVSR